MKDKMESLEISAVVSELKDLVGGYIQKVYKPNKGEISFRIHVPGIGKKMLIFRVGKALYLSQRDRENPMHPGDYTMLMRKYLSNSIISDVYQHELDRVVVIDLEREKSARLIFEVFGKGNLILEGEDRILLPYRSESWSHRELKKGELYRFPPQRLNPFMISENELIQILEDSEQDLVRTLAVDLNLGGKYSEEICRRLGVDKNTDDFAQYSEDIFQILNIFHNRIKHKDELSPCLVEDEEDIIDAVPFPLRIYEEYEQNKMDSYNKALDEAIPEPDEAKEEKDKKDSKLERKLDQQKRAVENLDKDIDEYKKIGDIIYQNYKACEEYLKAVHRAREEGRRDEIFEKMREIDDVLQVNDQDEYIVVKLKGKVDDEDLEKNVKLDFRKDVNENAQKYYNKSKKAKKKLKGAKRAIKETEKQIEEGREEELQKEPTKPTEKFWFDRYKWFISSEENLVIAGKDTKTNEEVVKKYMENDTRYAHADAGGAPSVVVKNDNGIGEASLNEACQYSLIHSKEWKRGIASGRAYWVKPSQVSKTAEAGESLPTGAFVIRGKRNYVDKLPLKAVLTEIDYEGNKKIMCAPSFALENRDDEQFRRRVIFIPGTKDQNEFAKEMGKYYNVPIKEIQKVLPPGGVKVLEKEEK